MWELNWFIFYMLFYKVALFWIWFCIYEHIANQV
jgi:hypothetical protein